MSNDWIYDIETYPNVFTFYAEHADSDLSVSYEISPWRNDSLKMMGLFLALKDTNQRLVGFNNIGFDYPVIHTLIRMGKSDAKTLYDKAMAIIGSQNDSDRWVHQVFPSDRYIEQVDLFKIHHFDNKARSTSLKLLEFNMRSKVIEDLPFPVGTELTQEQIDVLKEYNKRDVRETKKFYKETLGMIKFREEMVVKHPGRDWINFNDTKIGKEYFALKLEEAGFALYEFGPDGRKPKQTKRSMIVLRDAILPWITFEQPEFNRIMNWLKDQQITETKGVFKDLIATVNGFDFVFGVGGIHGSIESEICYSDEEFTIIDLDVSSYYPNLAIANNFYPEHFGEEFCHIYKHLYEQRKGYPKGSVENAMLKLALNGVYGDSNNAFSVFYDPLYMMKITLNGQLLLCKLAEMLFKIDQLQLIQVNTDGLTVRVPKDRADSVMQCAKDWESMTGLELERADYRAMYIRDVNNYVAHYEGGSVKRKGAYEYNLAWHQNASALVVPKVAEKVLLEGAPIHETVMNWPEPMDFMLRTKVPRSSYLSLERNEVQIQIQNVTRYYIAKDGGRLFKWMPPLKGKNEWRKLSISAGWNVCVCNDMNDAVAEIDYDYYIREVEKLVLGLS